jgi:tRNA threonylcarbamoyladenosine modification (KEOPS) complex  Pcc1 subunit
MRIAGIAALVVVVVVIGGFGLATFVNGRDSASVDSAAGPGTARTEAEAAGSQADVGTPGNIVLLHAGAQDGATLRALADDVAGPASPELERAGQAVIVRQDPQAGGVVAVSSTRVLRVPAADDPQLRAFIEAWLGNAESG